MPEGHTEELGRYVDRCALLAPQFRWTPATNLHLTLRFLGHVDRTLAEGIAERIEASRPHAFDLALDGLGTFKRGRLARVVWLGLSVGEAEIGRLAQSVEAESVRAGLEAEGRRYHAHLTLARARSREGADLPELPPVPVLPAWRADRLVLYRSILGRGGSVYEELRGVSLA